ncbi:hypothetical protein Nepgr_003582 [Nepenthes gracilis]|uniref:Uncharacterized protein n=1 Tax=Nepenthes gracilis TaxID=150966 RepID=A0AAD3RZW4_NEPGR|nr:hypothetical protein Nepgr_003582 [Nepenthes gracilis]
MKNQLPGVLFCLKKILPSTAADHCSTTSRSSAHQCHILGQKHKHQIEPHRQHYKITNTISGLLLMANSFK